MQTTVIKKTLLFALLVVTGSAWAEWLKIGNIDSATFYIDPATVRKDGNFRKVWEIIDLKTRDKNGELSYRMRMEYDCKEERARILSATSHSQAMASGKELTSVIGNGQWNDLPPDSNSETTLKIVCAK